MIKVGIIVAMDSELELIAKSLNDCRIIRTTGDFIIYYGHIDNISFAVCKSGIGKVNAAFAATKLIMAEKPDFIINTGVAGSLDERVKPTDIVIGNRVKYCDVWCGKPNAKGQIQDMPEWFPTMEVKTDSFSFSRITKKYHTKKDLFCVHCAPIVSGDAFMETVADRMKCLRASGHAKAVDMESGAIAQICYRFGTPFLPVRVISDVVGSEKHQAKYDNFWKDLANRSFDVSMQIIKEVCQQKEEEKANG